MIPIPTRRALLTALIAAPLLARAQSWPNQPIRWIVAYPPGGGSDFLARQLAPLLGKALGQTIIIDNRPGAGGIIGTDVAAKSPADGYTLLTGDNGAMVFNSAMYKKLPYSPGDFTPVGFMARFPLMLVVSPTSGFTNAKQWLAEVRAKPGLYSYASPGVGSPHHLAMELLKDRSHSFIVHVPYRGTSFVVQDVTAGVVPMAILDTAAGLPQVRAGKLRALAVLSRKRLPTLPDVPTFDELGVGPLDVAAWQGLFVPRGTPEPIVSRLTAEMNKAITTPELRARLEDFGLEVAPGDGPALTRFIQQETAAWHALIKDRRLAAD